MLENINRLGEWKTSQAVQVFNPSFPLAEELWDDKRGAPADPAHTSAAWPLSQNGSSSSAPDFSSHLSLLSHAPSLPEQLVSRKLNIVLTETFQKFSLCCYQENPYSHLHQIHNPVSTFPASTIPSPFLHFLFPPHAHEGCLCFRTWAFFKVRKWILKLLAQNKWIKGIKMFKARTTSLGGSAIASSRTKT